MARTKRLNLTLPIPLETALQKRAQAEGIGAPELARRMLADGLHRANGADLESALRQEYAALAAEGRRLAREFRHVDAEGWE